MTSDGIVLRVKHPVHDRPESEGYRQFLILIMDALSWASFASFMINNSTPRWQFCRHRGILETNLAELLQYHQTMEKSPVC